MIAPGLLRSTLTTRPCYSTFVMLQDPLVIPLLKNAGFDFLIIDHEHIPMSPDMVANLVTAARTHGIATIVRVRDLSRGAIQHALETGADGVMIPMVESATQARLAVEWSKYPPYGTRGLHTLSQAFLLDQTSMAGYPPPPHATLNYPQRMNEQVVVVVQIETDRGLAAREEICAVPGVDVVFIGTSDLSQSLGVSMQSSEFTTAVQSIIISAQQAAKTVGIIGGSADALQPFVDAGVNFLTLAVDGALLMHGAKTLLTRHDA